MPQDLLEDFGLGGDRRRRIGGPAAGHVQLSLAHADGEYGLFAESELVRAADQTVRPGGVKQRLEGKHQRVDPQVRVLGRERVPPGFTVTTEACVAFMREQHEPAGLERQVADAMSRLEQTAGKRFADEKDPLLVSVRSGARESMPGMLDTILNVGLNGVSVGGLASSTENERFAWDSYRRFVQMFGNVCRGVPGEKIEDAIKKRKSDAGVKEDTELGVDDLKGLVELHGIPAVFSPVLPILYQCVDWNVSLPEFCRDVEYLVLAGVAFSTLPISIRPFGKQRRVAREVAVI